MIKTTTAALTLVSAMNIAVAAPRRARRSRHAMVVCSSGRIMCRARQ
jgi:hypothetical protein